MSAFDRALEITLELEGPGTTNDPDDHGGLTYQGFTQRTYDGWRTKHQLPTRHVSAMTPGEQRQLAMDEFWLPCKCDQLPEPLAIAVFDMAFHSSPKDARIALQKALHVKVDGDIGPRTVAAAVAAGSIGLLYFLKKRAAEMQEIWIRDHSQLKYAEGWIARLLDQLWELK